MSDQDVMEVNYSFGQRLSSARRALNLTREQVAAELRLNAGLIQALEEEDYSNLPTQMYIAGYLRNYARLLKIPVEPLLTALDKAQLESPLLVNDVTRPAKASHSQLAVKVFALVLLAVVVTGVVSWVQMQDFAIFSEKPVADVKIESPELKGAPALITEAEEAVREIALPESKSESEIKNVPVEKMVAATVIEKVVEVEEEAVPVSELTIDVEQEKPIENGVKLAFVFSDDCWVEVKDSRGDTLVYDLYRDGQTKLVSGLPPFNIFLGNAPVVEIEYNGLAYDASAHIRGKLARFSLGQKEDYKSNIE